MVDGEGIIDYIGTAAVELLLLTPKNDVLTGVEDLVVKILSLQCAHVNLVQFQLFLEAWNPIFIFVW